MELRHLRYFVAVAEEKNFTRASKRLFIAQPPLSRQIQQLEEELGVSLIERDSRPLRLTEAGRFFYAHAQQLLGKAADLKSMTQRVGKIERTLSIGFVASTLYGILPKIIRRFRTEHNAVEISLHEMTTMEQIKALKDGSIDVGFGRIRHEDPNIRRIVLREERLIVALPAGHPLTASTTPLSLKDLLPETLIIFPKAPRPSFADQVLAAFSDRAIQPDNILEVRELQIAIGLVAAGQGVAIVPASVQGMKRDDVSYMELGEKHTISPVIFSVRILDQSEELRKLLRLIYDVYDAENIPHVKEFL
ncbi:DNA-binding transcriptional regulator, LysR family [Collimonas sp. OK607]|uniref:LysR family transcriptional regulator n=1 Tax=Collimonas sp. OK607 TaxID=1798194 RepID=UPI0008EB2F58|nr:LysR family transcriptional regulator [Collimonas sp. OK607]SFB06428.1 DNA-binding transcriptional regulator, LysR family [Collimonas sp. OK607]